MVMEYVLAKKAIVVHRLCAARNVSLARIVLNIKLVYNRSVKIHVQEHVV